MLTVSLAAIEARSTEIAVTIDDLPRTSQAPKNISRLRIAEDMISALKKHGVPQVFGFINAQKVAESPDNLEILKVWRKAGFPLGNHTYSHLNINDASAADYISDIQANEKTLKDLMANEDFQVFRYPFLREGNTLPKRDAVRDFLKTNSYQIAQVTIDFEDWLWNKPYARCADKGDKPGTDFLKRTYIDSALAAVKRSQQLSQMIFGKDIKHILLLHIGAFDSLMLDPLLSELEKQGHTFITLESAMGDPLYQGNPNQTMRSGDTFLDQWMQAKSLPYPKPSLPRPENELEVLCR